jgi:hypothetical protein
MQPKLTVSDYRFFFAPEEQGKFLWKGVRGNIFRRTKEDFDKMMSTTKYNARNEYEVLYGIANIEIVVTGENILVYEVFEDLRD